MKNFIILICVIFILTSCRNDKNVANTSNTEISSVFETVGENDIFIPTGKITKETGSFIKITGSEKYLNTTERFKTDHPISQSQLGFLYMISEEVGNINVKNQTINTTKYVIDGVKTLNIDMFTLTLSMFMHETRICLDKNTWNNKVFGDYFSITKEYEWGKSQYIYDKGKYKDTFKGYGQISSYSDYYIY